LLNIGVEEVKGLEQVREAGRILRETPRADLDYLGFVEGDDIGKGTVDVVVTEGFAGNIALKTAEGTARQLAEYLRAAMNQSLSARIGYLFARSAFRQLRHRMDPGRSNGGVFLGLNGIVIKSHGGTDAAGFAAAIDLGYGIVRDELLAKITAALGRQGHDAGQPAPQSAGGVAV
jgi:glycerol-3-phosphate acyltransferase PlsX